MDASILNYKVNDNVGSFLGQKQKLYINGKWVDTESSKTFDVEDPATGKNISTCAAGNSKDIDKAVKAARNAFDSGKWPSMAPNERGKIIWKIGDLIDSHTEELAQLESLDNGKPVAIAGAADVPLSSDIMRYMAGWATKIEGETIPISVPYTPGAQYHSYTLREPVGVVGQIIPWNFPLLMMAWKLAPALAAGCTIVLKPAEQTPLSALRLTEIIHESGILPEGVLNVVTGLGEDAGAPLAAHPDVDKVAFTGSTEVGKLITKSAAGNLKKVSLELGGKSPTIVFPDADIDGAIAGAASAIFFNHGQCCCAGSRLFVHEKIFDKVTEGIAKIAGDIKVGPGMDTSTEMGPLVSDEQFQKVSGYIESGKSDGGEIVAGGKYDNSSGGHFVHPTVFTKTDANMKLVKEEIFGPVVCAQPFSDENLEKIAHEANNTSFGLAASVWTKDISAAHKLAAKIRAGTVWINCHNIFDASLPFGGYKESGWGREMGHEVLKNYTELKAVTVNL
ncbi:MAG: aldehyde dehydrogenase family protein [Pseudomonadota bacterium]|nr:aldehyde dehydrogenase family protein [Pseudomonadota bacterium]